MNHSPKEQKKKPTNFPVFFFFYFFKIVGKPGSSKSLAMQLVADNFRTIEDRSDDKFSSVIPAFDIKPYQCSPLSTSGSIQEMFYQMKNNQNSYIRNKEFSQSVLILDEIGLAEHSPHLPLKVLHTILEDPDSELMVSVVGISNWALDPAKMNRGVKKKKNTIGFFLLHSKQKFFKKTDFFIPS